MSIIDLTKLEQKVATMWDSILTNSPFIHEVLDGKATKALYAIYMTETYHYTKHNAKNQALVGIMGKDLPGKYLSFCFHHAHEEAGHELMALSDIASIGFDREDVLSSKPLPATETLIAYLYWISATGNPVQRLGYSYWAENVYGYIDPVLKAIQSTLDLTPQSMKFFIAHSKIDAKHAEEVNEMLHEVCKTQEDVDSVVAVMENSLVLTARILDDVWKEYQLFQSGASDRYAFLRDNA
ncbi:TENA/THI-4 protein [Shewanella denitrificans OS217]|jgi:pyrroloquinoline quinone (PQQ) biosynthesis protein C|uniref:TENA/THI-4 protein n=1 Tax=Shewanella denitrificans (strain OS217 / ATCC BAA-1090 / DSM 15013) TaxID=318161 RepID=Q12HR3_SHEDO|nr:iron-containing redox enzyme family protein [Shewanella denitrificans]ABE57013.1 TENA/THI-4 protein [Shewanella denitrificans OS217]